MNTEISVTRLCDDPVLKNRVWKAIMPNGEIVYICSVNSPHARNEQAAEYAQQLWHDGSWATGKARIYMDEDCIRAPGADDGGE